MNESEARQVMLVRALETPPGISQWQEEDRDWASRQAVSQLGAQATTGQFVVRRAALAVDRLRGRLPEIQRLLSSLTWRGWILPVLVVVAFVLGLVADAVSANRQINILAPPLFALLIWNLAVYLMIGVHALRGLLHRDAAPSGVPGAAVGPSGAPPVSPASAPASPAAVASARATSSLNSPGPNPPASAPSSGVASPAVPSSSVASSAALAAVSHGPAARDLPRPPGPLTRLVARLAGATLSRRSEAELGPALGHFVTDWLRASTALTTARSHACLHFAAAAFAAGALTGLYARGLAFEFLAGWDSTFLDANGVHLLLKVVLGPASLLTGLPLPDVDHLARLRFSGSPGENAATWIHLLAVTIGLFVILPRLLLGATAEWRAHRLARDFPLSLDDPYFRHLDRRHRGAAATVQVVPYSFTIGEPGRRALDRLMHRTYGENTRVDLAPVLQLGDEDVLAEYWRPDPEATLVVVLYSATATPEHENHGAVIDAVERLVGPTVPVVAMVDEAGFRQRFGNDPARLAGREAAWRKLISAHVDGGPFFVSLDDETGDETADRLEAWLNDGPGDRPGRLGHNAPTPPRADAAPAGTSA